MYFISFHFALRLFHLCVRLFTLKAGQSTGHESDNLDVKAQHWALQYLRLILHDELNFYMGKIKAKHSDLLTMREWEKEMFQQIDGMLSQRGIEQTFPQCFPSQSIVELEKVMADDEDDEGVFYKMRPNASRTEVRVYAQHMSDANGQTRYDTTMPEIKQIINGICRKENPKSDLYHQRLEAKERSERVKAKTNANEKGLATFFTTVADESYTIGYKSRGTVNTNGLEGGGNLPLNKEGTLKLYKVFRECISQTWSDVNPKRTLRIYWIGCGFGEEVLCILRLAKKNGDPIFIYATDIEQDCLDILQTEVVKRKLQNRIKIVKADVYTTDQLPDKFDIVYTSAALTNVFTFKILYLAIACPEVQFMLCNHTHCVFLHDRLEGAFKEMAKDRLTLVDACLEPESKKQKREERWIYALDISRYVY